MSTPVHHLPEAWLVAMAAGTLGEAESVVVATHITLCPQCRNDLALAEEIAAGAMNKAPEVAMNPGGLDALLARLDEPAPPEPVFPTDPVLPWPILQHTGPLAQVKWKSLGPWVSGIDMPHQSVGLPLRLVRLSAGVYLPHRHVGSEAAVILAGGWTDETGHYQRGDAFYAEPSDHVHEQRIDEGPPCIALVLNEQRGKVDGFLGLLAKAFFKV